VVVVVKVIMKSIQHIRSASNMLIVVEQVPRSKTVTV